MIQQNAKKKGSGIMLLYKFTPYKFLKNTILHSRLKVTSINDVNDPYEMVPHIVDSKTGGTMEISNVKTLVSKLAEQIAMICFTTEKGDPVIWRYYAGKDPDDTTAKDDEYTGVALEFSCHTMTSFLSGTKMNALS